MSSTRRSFFIDSQLRARPEGDAAAMGFKGYNLARMAAIGLPVPPAFVIGTGYTAECAETRDGELPVELQALLASHLRRLDAATGLTYGGSRKPLLVSVRSGAAQSMPGMMDTILNVGLNETTVRGLLRMTGNPRLIWDSYRRLVQSYAQVVDGVAPHLFDGVLRSTLERLSATRAQELDARTLADLAHEYLAVYRKACGRAFPQDPMEQLRAAVKGVFRSWHSERAREYRRLNRLEEGAGTAVTVQRMVFGNAGGTSGSGVAFTRDPATGAAQLYMDFMFDAQGEDVVSGRHAILEGAQLGLILPHMERQVLDVARALEAEFGDMQEFEFTVQDETLYVLQTRTGKRTPLAALRIAVDLAGDGLIESAEALSRLHGIDVERLRETRLASGTDTRVLGTGTPASPGVVSGAVVFDVQRAHSLAQQGPVILVRGETSTEDVAGFAVAAGLLTAMGGRTSHAAVVAREMGKPCVVGCAALAIEPGARACRIGAERFAEGDVLSLDGSTGQVIAGAVEVVSEVPERELAEYRRWCAAAAALRKPRQKAPVRTP